MTNHTNQARERIANVLKLNVIALAEATSAGHGDDAAEIVAERIVEALTTPNHLVVALKRVRAWFAGYVANEGKGADEELALIDEALATRLAVGDELTEAMIEAGIRAWRDSYNSAERDANRMTVEEIWNAMRKAATKGEG